MARKKRIYIEPEKDLTTMLFCSLMLILLTFFIVLSTLGVQDNQRHRMAMNSLLGSFGILSGGKSPYTDGGSDILPPAAPITRNVMGVDRIRAAFREAGLLNGLGISEGALGTTVTIKSSVLFEEDSDVFYPGAREVLDVLSTILLGIDNHLIITGHTDSVPMEDPPFYSNWSLSAARSYAVLAYLEGRGLAPERLVAYGMGSQRPLSSNATSYGRNLNRRVEIEILGNLPGGVDTSAMEDLPAEPVQTFQYKGFKFQLEEQ